MTDRYDAAPPVERIEVSRVGFWVLVRLDGELVWKRHTRDPAFTDALVGFSANRSPQVPKSRFAFDRVELLGGWRPGERARWAGRNGVRMPIPADGDPPTVWTPTAGVHDPAPVTF